MGGDNPSVKINGETRVVGVFGFPVKHSASPAMQNAAFAACHLNCVYLPFEVAPAHLAAALRGVREMNFLGVNLTVPHKVLAMTLLDEIKDYAKVFGAVNTVRVRNGKLQGFNTDGYGLVQGLREDFGISLKRKGVVILGAGGAGRAAAIMCALEGASWIGLANRTVARAKALTEEVKWANKRVVVDVLEMEEEALRGALRDADLVINTTSLGLKKSDRSPLPASCFRRGLLAYDMIYSPRRSPFVLAARKAGARAANGASMLLHQGAKSFEIWTGRRAPVAAMRRALQRVLKD